MRQWCLPAVAPRAEPLLAGRPSPPRSDSSMESCEVEPRYTIEQIDLLQRLRLSGMSKPQIIQALESLERLDPTPQRQPCCDTHAPPGSAPPPAAPSSSSFSSLTSATTQTPTLDASLSPSNSCEASSPPLYPTGAGQKSFSYDAVEEDWDLEEKVEEYMRRDSSLVKEEIKAFLNNRRISQAIVGQVTGISQSYISQWLLQQGLEMSESKRRSFYRWYLLERNTPGGYRWNESQHAQVPRVRADNPWSRQRELLTHLLPWYSSHSAQPGSATSLRPLVKEEPDWRAGTSPGGSGAVNGPVRLRRGSRFTWRKECQSIMESFFVENQYPDEAKREEIANACNFVIQKPGCKLSEFERVTALKVYNWFANRRKEMKRRANIEAAILESHGIEVQSPSCQSNGEEVEVPEFAEQEEVSTEKDTEVDTGPLAVEPEILLKSTPPLQLANQEQGESKREVANEA
ncbi:homeobox-containing protein 1 isoform X2 [Scleropages formosus]|uniref:Homeobox-containing protein 1 n=1 Tax=Scleropages formosus TaxID=113540 RepID=A0A8C9RDK2_SCLFO|nr:homeobox-containing protein 1-like isoform X2 [Scleropages formosus]